MNEYIIEAHLELHRQIMEFVKSKVPAKRMFKDYDREREYSLDSIEADEGTFTVKYSRYAGCGDYDYETMYLTPADLFKEQA